MKGMDWLFIGVLTRAGTGPAGVRSPLRLVLLDEINIMIKRVQVFSGYFNIMWKQVLLGY